MTTQVHERELTSKEQAILEMYLQNKTMRQIGAALGMDFGNVCRTLRRPRVRAVIDAHISARLARSLEKSSKDLEEMLQLEQELARSGTRDDVVRLKAVQGRIARHLNLLKEPPPEPDATTESSDDALLAGLQRIKDTRPDLLTAAGLAPTDPPE